MIDDKDIRDIQAFTQGLLPLHREERFKERLKNEPELKAKFEELTPILNALDEINHENKVREIIKNKASIHESALKNEEVARNIVPLPAFEPAENIRNIVPFYKQLWVYVAAACVLILVGVGLDYVKNKKVRAELLGIEQREKAREDSLKVVYAQQKQVKKTLDSNNFKEPEKQIIANNNDSIPKKQKTNSQNLLNNQDEKPIIVKSPKNIEKKNNIHEQEVENKNDDHNDEVSALNSQNNFTRIVKIVFMNQKGKTNDVDGKLNVRLSKKEFGNANQVGSVTFSNQNTPTFNLSIFDEQIYDLLRTKKIQITQQSNDGFLLDLGNVRLTLNTQLKSVMR